MTYRGGGKPGNKNAEKWTEEKALELANKLIKWLNEPIDFEYLGLNDGTRVIRDLNIFYTEFLVQNDLDDSTIDYLCDKFESFSEIIKKAKKIQETKLAKFGVAGVLNPTMTIFLLKNHHGYKDRIDTDITSGGEIIVPQVTIIPYNQLKSANADDKNLIE